MRNAYLFLAGFLISLPFSTNGAAEDSTRIVDIRGFKVDFSRASEREQKLVFDSLDKQLKIVEAAQVPPKVMEFFRSVPIMVDPVLQNMNGAYLPHEGRWIVRIQPTRLPGDRPIVLHELLHAFHHQVLKQPTPQVGRAYRHAIQERIYPERYYNAHFLENGKEYFAVIGSIYLFDKRIDQPPFDCSIPSKSQPEFIAFLAEQFGERKCN